MHIASRTRGAAGAAGPVPLSELTASSSVGRPRRVVWLGQVGEPVGGGVGAARSSTHAGPWLGSPSSAHVRGIAFTPWAGASGRWRPGGAAVARPVGAWGVEGSWAALALALEPEAEASKAYEGVRAHSCAWRGCWRGAGAGETDGARPARGRRAKGMDSLDSGGRAGAKASLNRAQPEGDRDIGGDSLY